MATPTTNQRTPRSWKKLTQEEYDHIKLLAASGVKMATIAEIQKRAYGTISRVVNSKSLTGYHEEIRGYAQAKKAARTPKQDSVREIELPPFLREDEPQVTTQSFTMRQNVERIATALERLADAWERQPEKKIGLFK